MVCLLNTKVYKSTIKDFNPQLPLEGDLSFLSGKNMQNLYISPAVSDAMESKDSRSPLHVDVISDITCPWCYIGKRRLEKALQTLRGKLEVTVEYHPFELNPHISDNGSDQKEFLINKFGGPDQYERMTSHVSDIALKEGLTFNFDIQHVLPNTRRLHALILFSKARGKQLQLTEAFFKAYFTDGVDLSDKGNIIEIAGRCGMDRSEVEKISTDERALQMISASEENVQRMGIHSVPFYIINHAYGISGAQPTEVFVKTFEEIASNLPLTT